ncbi:unnamed protein product [Caenorhabditis auriculariae]|uniref:Deltamethrin resistance protein prag01 domain-containing protein n=1 Tax=Caenorhabditis auriculariae TaxID=2777116 RepID=A0A8S1HSC3_9PELO|nr:unnamed protein product [Caenorhabditis auriculariae]
MKWGRGTCGMRFSDTPNDAIVRRAPLALRWALLVSWPSEGLSRSENGSGGHHEVVNVGPPTTFDYMPIPFQSYQKVHGELQAKFNMYLAVSAALFASSFFLAIYTDVFCLEALRPPQSYRNRK